MLGFKFPANPVAAAWRLFSAAASFFVIPLESVTRRILHCLIGFPQNMEDHMSWLPPTIPNSAMPISCDALDLVIVPRVRDLGDGFAVRRALPHGKRQMVGPFIFFDQMGPVQMIAGKGMDVRPHPHIGLATVTYLFDGRIMHRDSEGNIQEIVPGAMNLMTAGRGIAHSERTPDIQRRDGQSMYGIQSWIALPKDREEIAPTFQHFEASRLPIVMTRLDGTGHRRHGVRQDLAGRYDFGVVLRRGHARCRRRRPLDADHEERAIYLVEGEVEIAGDRFEGPRLLIFRPAIASRFALSRRG